MLSAASIGTRLGAQSLVSPSFTTAQAESGKAAYAQSCESCHGANLDDGEFAPPLKGVEFRSAVGRKAGRRPLFNHMSETMPPAAPGSLGDENYAQMLAYVMQENGVIAGTIASFLPIRPFCCNTMLLAGGSPADRVAGSSLGVAVPRPPRHQPARSIHAGDRRDAERTRPPASG